MFPSFVIFGKEIGMYSICAVVGLIAAAAFAYRYFKKIGLDIEDVVLFELVVLAGVMVGGHLLFGVTQMGMFINNIGKVSSIRSFFELLVDVFGGSVFYGGFLGTILAVYIYMKVKKFEHHDYLKDIVFTSVPLFHAFGRIGCFFGGCCYGIECSFGFIVHGNEYSPGINDVRRFPTPLLEALLNFCIFFLLWALFRKGKFVGNLLYIYMLIYPVVRFCLEFLRGDEIRGFFGPLSTSQWISLALFVYAIIRLSFIYLIRKKDN